jgi:hypothetical protein
MQETSQVRLRIISPTKEIFNEETGATVTGKEVLKQMKTNNVWKNDTKGKYASIQFDAFEYQFREGETITVPETVARALRKNSIICVGSDKLNGPLVPFVEVVEKFELGEPTAPVAKTPTTCPICGEDQKTFPALTRHLGQERKKHPELFEEEKKGTQWDAPDANDGDDAQ